MQQPTAALSTLLLRVQAGYQHRRLFIQLTQVGSLQTLTYHCRLLRQAGVCTSVALTLAAGRGSRSYTIRLGLRYLAGSPAMRVLTFPRARAGGRALTYAAICQLGYTYPGIRFFLQTPQGYLSLDQCIHRRCGGVLCFGLA